MASFWSFLRNLLKRSTSRRFRRDAPDRFRRRLTVEPLETRTLPNNAPILQPLADVVLPRWQSVLEVPVSAWDPDGDFVTLSAALVGPSPAAQVYALDAQYDLTMHGNYFANFLGYQEKWLQGNDAQYFLLPSGELRRWRDTAYSFGPDGLVATLDARFYEEPTYLWQAADSIGFVRSQLFMFRPVWYVGVFTVEVTASDGIASTSDAFDVTIANAAPVLAPLGNRVLTPPDERLVIPILASDGDGDPLTYAAQTVGVSDPLYQLDQQLGLSYLGSYFTNFQGRQEKWLGGAGAQYFILPNGELRRWRDTAYSYGAAGLVATLTPSVYDEPSRLWNARPAVSLSLTGNQLTIARASDYYGVFTVQVAVSDGFATSTGAFQVTVPDPHPIWQDVHDWTLPHGQDKLTVPLSATSSFGPVSYSARIVGPAPLPLPVLAIVGNQLTIDPAAGFHGTFGVEVTAANALAVTPVLFNVSVPNAAPVLGPLANQTMPHQQNTLTVALSATDADREPLTFSATVLGPVATAYDLDQRLGLSYMGSYFTNFQGHQEKWLQGADGQYFILPNGELRRWRDVAYSYGPQGLVATLDAGYYADPAKLWNAPAPPAVSVAGSQLTVDPASLFVGTFAVQVTVSDGLASAGGSFAVTVTNAAPVLSVIGKQAILPTRNNLTLTLPGSDADADPLTYSANVRDTGLPGLAYQLDQQLNLSSMGSYFTNFQGRQEKWLQGNDAQYLLLPNGELRRWRDAGYSYGPGLVATLDGTYYADPSKLWDARLPVAVSLLGNQLTLAPSPGYHGTFAVDVSVTDGMASARTSFAVAVPDGSPLLTGLHDWTMTPGQARLVIPLTARSFVSPVTYTARLLDMSLPVTLATKADQLLIDPAPGYRGTFTVEVTANSGVGSSRDTFRVTVPPAPPTLSGLPARVFAPHQASTTLTLTATDPSGLPLSYSAQVIGTATQGYDLDQRLGLSFMGRYFTNFQGHQEKWLQGNDAQYFVLPTGELRRWRDSVYSYGAAGLVATLDRGIYADPAKLWNAQPLPNVTLAAHRLTIDPRGDFEGRFTIQVTVSNGHEQTTGSFDVFVTDRLPNPGSVGITGLTDLTGKSLAWVTNQTAVYAVGVGAAGTRFDVLVDGAIAASGQVGSDGQWKAPVNLTQGEQFIETQTADSFGLGSSIDVSVDMQPPILSLSSKYTITETIELTVQVNSTDGYPLGTQAVVDIDRNGDGDFADIGERNVRQVDVLPGPNTFYLDPRDLQIEQIRVRLKDEAGNEGVSPAAIKAKLPPALPVRFDVNQGQVNSQTRYLVHGDGYNAHLTGAGLTLAVQTTADPIWGGETTLPLNVRFAGANPAPTIVAEDRLAGFSNYYLGSDPTKWKTNVPNFAQVRYQQVYPGVDVLFRDGHGQLRYDIMVAAGADPNRVVLEFPEAQGLAIDQQGQLLVSLPGGQGPQLIYTAPLFFQRNRPHDQRPTGGYVLRGPNQVGFEVKNRDPSLPLLIDPILFSTYLGGSERDGIEGLALDGTGNTYITGTTASSDFPVSGGVQGQNAGGKDIFVTKLNAAGTAILYSTYVGGAGDDQGWDLALDSAGNIYVAGDSDSTNFPTTSGAFQPALRGMTDAVVFKLNGASGGFAYATYLGGADDDSGRGIAVFGDTALITGQASGSTFPTTAGAVEPSATFGTTFLTRLNATGSALTYSTYIGGDANLNEAHAVGVDAAGNAYVAGASDIRLTFPTTPGAFQTTPQGGLDGFLLKVNPAGSAYLYGTLLGGAGDDFAYGVAVDGPGSAYLTGTTASTNFPTTPGAYQTTFVNNANQPVEAFVTKFNLTGSNLAYSTYLGGRGAATGGDRGLDIAVDAGGDATVVGKTDSTQFPLSRASQSGSGGDTDAFVSTLSATGSSLSFSTFLGGSAADAANAVAVNGTGNLYVAGQTESVDFPTVGGPSQSNGAGGDGFVVSYGPLPPPVALPAKALPPEIESVQVVNAGQQPGNEEEVEIAVDPSNPQRLFFGAVQDTRATGLQVGFSGDGGQTWNRRFIADGSDTFPAACCDPAVSWDTLGNLFLTYITFNLEVVLLLSTDGGASFTRVASLGNPFGDQPKVATGANSVWLTWALGSVTAVGAPVTGLGQVGAFGAAQVLPNTPGGNFGNITIGPVGQVIVSISNTVFLGPDVIRTSLDPDGLGPQGFGNPVLVSTTNVGGFQPIAAQPLRTIDADARVAFDRSGGPFNGRVYIDYVDAPSTSTNDTNIFVRFSDDSGQTWSPAIRVSDDTNGSSQFWPRLAVDQTTGFIGVAFYDTRGDTGPGTGFDSAPNTDTRFHATFSLDGGQTFLPNFQIAGGPSSAIANPNGGFEYGDYTGAAFHDGKFYAAWADNSNSTGDNPGGTFGSFDIYVGITTLVPPVPFLPDDIFELNEVDDRATNFGVLTTATPLAFTDLTISRHRSTTRLPDYDWYRLQPATSGTLSVTLGDIRPRFRRTDLHVRIFELVNGAQIELGASRNTGGNTSQSVSVSVRAGAQIFVWVYGFNYAEAFYNLSITLV